jgi:hypothetical protein
MISADALQANEYVLDNLLYGAAFLSANGWVLHLNLAAERILRQADGLH